MDGHIEGWTFQHFRMGATSVLNFHRGLGATFGGLGASNVF